MPPPRAALPSALLLAVLSASPAAAQSPSGTWSGTYRCAQGVTGMTLTLEPAGGRAVRATMSFYAVAGNPRVPSGRYALEGEFDPGTGRLSLSPSYWIAQPAPRWVMVGLDGRLRGDAFDGVLVGNPSCTTFGVTRGA